MRAARWLGLVAAVALPGAVAIAQRPAGAATFEVTVLATPHDPDARATEIVALHVDHGSVRRQKLGVVTHPPGAVVRGDVRGASTWVVADETAGDWGAALYEVDTRGTRRVVGSVGHARRPLAGSSEVFVERGTAGSWPNDAEIKAGALRTDAIAIDAYDPNTGVVRHVYSAPAYALHLAGESAGELVLYRVDRTGASIALVDERSGVSRSVALVLPFARDFSVDARGDLVFSNRDAIDGHVWVALRMDLRTGAITRLHSTQGDEPAALALSSGVAWSADNRRGLFLGGRTLTPLGAGFDVPVLATRDDTLLAFMHVEEGRYDRAAVLDMQSGSAVGLGTDERVTVLTLRADHGGVR